MTVKCDFHVHSKYSDAPTNWIAKNLGCPESFVDPIFVYEMATSKGMTHVTLTDHNDIRGCLELLTLDYDNTFISCEITASFPEDGCQVHVLVYDITEQQYNILMGLRKNIYNLVKFVRKEKIKHAIAHPLYSVNNLLMQQHFEKLLLLFDLIELNGFRSDNTNETTKFVVDNLTDELLVKLADKHGIDDSLVVAANKNFIRGSDDHSGAFIASNYTLNEKANNIEEVFNFPEHNIMKGENARPQDLAYEIYSTGYKYISNKFDLNKYVKKDNTIKAIDSFLNPEQHDKGSIILSAIRAFRANKKFDCDLSTNGFMDKMLYMFSDIKSVNQLQENVVSDKWFDITVEATNKIFSGALDTIFETTNIFKVLHTITNLFSLYMISLPHFISYYVFQQTRNIALSLNIENEIKTKPLNNSIAHFTDTFYEINGVANTLRQIQEVVNDKKLDYKILVCSNEKSKLGEVVFNPVKTYGLPVYKELSLYVPSLLEMLKYCYDNNFSYIHSATPGPIGLAGLLIAKILQKPFYSTYHTSLPQYVQAFTEDKFMVDLCWQYVKWFYNQCDKVFVPSTAFVEKLEENGIDRDKLLFFNRGIDVNKFMPGPKKRYNNKFRLLYVGRISIEKGLSVLSTAFKELQRNDVELFIVGNGPYKETMEKDLENYNVTFTGYLEGADLVAVYQQADIFVLPSTTDTFGNVVLEANACGLPAIVTNIGGPAENVINNETGLIVEGNNVTAFKDGILKLLNKELINKMGKKARREVENRSFDKALMEWIKLYE